MDVAINYLSVLVAAAGMMGVGFLWYGPLFGKYWMKLMGYTPESMKSMKMSARTAMILAGVAALITSFVLAILSRFLNPLGFGGAFMLALLIWVGFIATTHANSVLFEDRDPKLYLLNVGQIFVSLFVASLILTLWP